MYQQNLSSLSPWVLQHPGNEVEFRSDKKQASLDILLLSVRSILWFRWHAWFSGMAHSGHAQKPFFTSNEPNIFALPPPRRGFACGVHLTKCNPSYWRQKMPSEEHLYSWEGDRGANPPTQQPDRGRFESPASGEKTLKKVPKKVILLKSTEESTQKCTKKSAQVKKY